MFVVLLRYSEETEAINNYLDEHTEFMQSHTKIGTFNVSNRKLPNNGDILLSSINCKITLENKLNENIYVKNNLANYEILEFHQPQANDELQFIF